MGVLATPCLRVIVSKRGGRLNARVVGTGDSFWRWRRWVDTASWQTTAIVTSMLLMVGCDSRSKEQIEVQGRQEDDLWYGTSVRLWEMIRRKPANDIPP